MPQLSPLPPDYRPDWEQVRIALLCQGEPDWVPFLEGEIDPSHWQCILGHPVRSIADYLEVQRRLGQPFMAADMGLHKTAEVLQVIGEATESERSLALGTGRAIRSEADLEAFPWPDPDDLDFGMLAEMDKRIEEHLAGFLKGHAVLCGVCGRLVAVPFEADALFQMLYVHAGMIATGIYIVNTLRDVQAGACWCRCEEERPITQVGAGGTEGESGLKRRVARQSGGTEVTGGSARSSTSCYHRTRRA